MKPELDESKLLYISDRQEWRLWLEKHYHSKKEAWLVYYKKHTGKSSLAYNDSVEEALCFGWIDSTVRKIDEDRYVQRFSPRKPGSHYSQSNKERLKILVEKGLVAEDVLATLGDVT
jgi:uncharacterized protein YdeI (YjbR/CyaY-like superfamily)